MVGLIPRVAVDGRGLTMVERVGQARGATLFRAPAVRVLLNCNKFVRDKLDTVVLLIGVQPFPQKSG